MSSSAQPPPPPRQRARLDPPASGADGAARSELKATEVNRLAAAQQPHVRLINVGYGNLVAMTRIVAIVAPAASPMRRLRREAAERGKLVDATEGRRTRSILIMDSDHVVLSAINPETLAARLLQEDGAAGE
jgi:extracellular matrix regulatory protein A